MKKWKVFLSLLLVLMFMSTSVFAAAYPIKWITVRIDGKNVSVREVPVVMDGKQIHLDVPSYIIKAGYTYVPIRFVTERYGAKVDWIQQTNTAVVKTAKGTEIKLTINSRNVYVNGKKQVIPSDMVPKFTVFNYGTKKADGRTMVPLRFISELLGYEVGYDKAKGLPFINTPKQEEPSRGGSTAVNKVTEIKKEVVNGKEAIAVYKTASVKVNTSKLTNPQRLVFDLQSSILASGGGSYQYNISIGPVTKVRVSQFSSDVVRVVLDIADGEKNPEVELINNKDKLYIIPKGVASTPSKPNIIISLDPGHGGKDPGAVQNGINEKDINLLVGTKLNVALKNAGYDTLMTRDSDVYVDLKDRAELANSNEANVFISLHCNSFTSDGAKGIEVLYNPNRANSQQLAQMLLDELVKATGANNRGIKQRTDLAVLNQTTMPAALIEMGFISNKEEAEKLKDPSYQNKIVQAIVNGVEKYFSTYGK